MRDLVITYIVMELALLALVLGLARFWEVL